MFIEKQDKSFLNKTFEIFLNFKKLMFYKKKRTSMVKYLVGINLKISYIHINGIFYYFCEMVS